MRLKTMTRFITDTLDNYHENGDSKRTLQLIKHYTEFLATPIDLKMFSGQDPLIMDFIIVPQQTLNYKKSVFIFSDDEFGITILKYYSPGDKKQSYVTSYHLKTIEDLCGRDIEIDEKQWRNLFE